MRLIKEQTSAQTQASSRVPPFIMSVLNRSPPLQCSMTCTNAMMTLPQPTPRGCLITGSATAWDCSANHCGVMIAPTPVQTLIRLLCTAKQPWR